MDLRPSFARDFLKGVDYADSESVASSEGRGGTGGIVNPDAREILFTRPGAVVAFDRLAQAILHYLEFPDLLVEGGVSGYATLDLYFDHEGMVDENRSRFSGGHRALRGLLVIASRKGIQMWAKDSASRLQAGEFKNQHFHADFEISEILGDSAKVRKVAANSYAFEKRRYWSPCLFESHGLNVLCVAKEAYGVAKRALSDTEKARLRNYVGYLADFDDLGLQGINALVQRAT